MCTCTRIDQFLLSNHITERNLNTCIQERQNMAQTTEPTDKEKEASRNTHIQISIIHYAVCKCITNHQYIVLFYKLAHTVYISCYYCYMNTCTYVFYEHSSVHRCSTLKVLSYRELLYIL